MDEPETKCCTKCCTKCGEIKSIDNFYKYSRKGDEHRPSCKECESAQQSKYREENKDAEKKRRREWYEKNKEVVLKRSNEQKKKNKDWTKEVKKKYYEKNKEAITRKTRERDKERYRKNKKELLEKGQKYRKSPEGKEKMNGHNRKRRALKRKQLHPSHDPAIEKQLEFMRQRIENCLGVPHALDHVWPMAKGGLHHHENLQVISAKLNGMKKDSLDFRHPDIKHWTDLPDWLIEETKNWKTKNNSCLSSEERYSVLDMNQIIPTIGLLTEFLFALPYNLQVVGNDESGETLLVSNLQENFSLEFSPFRMNGEEITIPDFLNKLSDGDESIAIDFQLTAEREGFIAKIDEREETPEGWELD